MRMFDVQGIEIVATRTKVFEFLREPRNMPQWAHAFGWAEESSPSIPTLRAAVLDDRRRVRRHVEGRHHSVLVDQRGGCRCT